MVQEQYRFFDDHYLNPACRIAEQRGIRTALGQTVVYDSRVHGSFDRICARLGTSIGPDGDDERAWIGTYVAVRGRWLRSHRNRLLRKTVYRMETFQRQQGLRADGVVGPLTRGALGLR
jgi:chitosanase